MTAITQTGQPCRHCGAPVVKRTHQEALTKKKQKRRAKQSYHFEWWFKCPKCKALFMVEAAKVWHEGVAAARVREQMEARELGFFPGRDG